MPTASGFATRLALFYAAIFIAVGVQLPFFPVWLAARGLDARTIGFVLAAPTLVRIFAIPFITGRADRTNSLTRAIVLACAVSVLGYAALGLAAGPAAITLAYILAMTAFTSAMPLADAYALRGLAQHGRAYGPVRLWGSATFVLGSFAAGVLLDIIAPQDLIWLIVAATLATTVVAAALPAPAGAGPIAAGAVASATALLRDRGFLAVLVAASLIQASHAVYYGFSSLDWQVAGLDATAIAALWALGVMAEIVLFAVSARLPLGPTTLLAIGAAGAALRWTAMAFSPPHWALPILQGLHALSFGATHLGALGYVSRAAPPGRGATAQGYLAIAMSIGMAAAMALSGLLYAAYGGRAYAAMAALALVGGGVVLAAGRRRI
jgi:PPP family 3-phenylpropionic acid transporter